MSPLQTVKFWLVSHAGLAKDALHIYVSLIVFFGVALALKTSVKTWKPWAAVLLVAVIGEIWDLRDSYVNHSPINLWANWHDIWNTLFWPSAIVLLARFTALFDRKTLPESTCARALAFVAQS